MFKTKEASPSTAAECRTIADHPVVAAAWAKLEAARQRRDDASRAYAAEDERFRQATTTPGASSPVELAAIQAAYDTLAESLKAAGLPVPPPPALRPDLKAKMALDAAEAAVVRAEREYHDALRTASPDVCRTLNKDRLPIQQRLVGAVLELLKSFNELEDLDGRLRSQGVIPTDPWRSVNWSNLPTFPQLLRKFRANGQDFQRNNKAILAKG